MKFKGTIVITDPCYVMNEYKDKRPDFNTWPGLEEVTHTTKFEDFTEDQRQAYREYEKARREFNEKYDDWDKCDCGENMEALGITHYITKNTIYGDWSCTTYATSDPKKAVNDLAKIAKYFNDKYEEYGGYKVITDEQYASLCNECDDKHDALGLKVENIGHFCADAGLVSVFLLDEILAYNPDFLEWAESHSHCVTFVKDFDGDVEYYVDEAGDAHIIGTGSTNFFTTQTGL